MYLLLLLRIIITYTGTYYYYPNNFQLTKLIKIDFFKA